jgi:hypothetical protein
LLTPRPRDFATGKYKIRTTESGTGPTDDDLIQRVRQGLYGTAMPGWERILADDEIRNVVSYIKGMAPELPQPKSVVRLAGGFLLASRHSAISRRPTSRRIRPPASADEVPCRWRDQDSHAARDICGA